MHLRLRAVIWNANVVNCFMLHYINLNTFSMAKVNRPWQSAYRQQRAYIWREPSQPQWRHNERDGVSNHQRLCCLQNRLLRRRPGGADHRKHQSSAAAPGGFPSQRPVTRRLRVTGLCEGNPPGAGGFPSQRASNEEYVSPFDDVILKTKIALGRLNIWWKSKSYLLVWRRGRLIISRYVILMVGIRRAPEHLNHIVCNYQSCIYVKQLLHGLTNQQTHIPPVMKLFLESEWRPLRNGWCYIIPWNIYWEHWLPWLIYLLTTARQLILA